MRHMPGKRLQRRTSAWPSHNEDDSAPPTTQFSSDKRNARGSVQGARCEKEKKKDRDEAITPSVRAVCHSRRALRALGSICFALLFLSLSFSRCPCDGQGRRRVPVINGHRALVVVIYLSVCRSSFFSISPRKFTLLKKYAFCSQ